MVDGEIQLISDGDNLAVIGQSSDVERFLASEGLESKDLDLPRLNTTLRASASVAQAGSEIAASSGRWVKLTKESAQGIKKYGLMDSKTPGVSHAMVGKPGSIKSWIQIEKSGSLLSNPAVLSGAAGLMAQLAMQQAIDEITDYLAAIDEKVDDVLRAQKDAVIADMIGVDLVIEEAMTIRGQVGRVSEVTWSKVQGTSAAIARTQAYALRQLDALAEKLESKADIGDLAKAAKKAETSAQEWLAVLARCFQLQDETAVLELDRVLESSADELDRHRIGLLATRQNRLALISRSTERLVGRMSDAASRANAKVLFHPSKSPAVVHASNQVSSGIHAFHGSLGIEFGRQSSDPKRWVEAAEATKDRILESGAEGVDAARRFGNDTVSRAKAAKGRLADRISERHERRKDANDEDPGHG